MTAYFPALTIDGVTYDFAHLDPFTFKVTSQLAKRDLRVHVITAFPEVMTQLPILQGSQSLAMANTNVRSAQSVTDCHIQYRP